MNRPDRSRNQNDGNNIPTGNCFGYGQPGHYRNACPRSKKTQSKSESEQQETSRPNARTVTRRGLWLVPGTIEGVKVEMLVDSGSDRALVDSKFYNSIPAAARPRLGPSTWSVDTTSGSPIVAIGEAEFHLQLGNLTCSYPFVVADLGLRRISVVIGLVFLEDSECLVDMGHGLLRIQDEKILMRREFSTDYRIIEQKEQVNSDEPKIAAEIPEPQEVASPSESSPLSQTSIKTRTSRKKRKRKRRSHAQIRIGNVKWNERQKFHGPWQYGPYEWRCEVKACHQVEAFPTFSSLEKHLRKVHHSKRIEYVCAFRGPVCCRNPKHDPVRNHCRNTGQHRRIPKPVRMAQTEPWIWAINPDYVEVCNIRPLPKDPVGGQILYPTPTPLAFAASMYSVASPAVPITSPVVGTRCTKVQHNGAYAAVRQIQTPVAQVAQPLPTQVIRRASSFPAIVVKSGVINSRFTPVTSVKPMEAVSFQQVVERRHELSIHPSKMVQMF